jgi:hypothetical protein
MAKPYDASLKELIESYPADWLALAGVRTEAVHEAEPWLMHIELQSSPKSDLAEWLHWYNTLVHHRHRQRVRSVVVLLRPTADSPALGGIYQKGFPASCRTWSSTTRSSGSGRFRRPSCREAAWECSRWCP